MQALLEEAKAIQDKLVSWRRHIHQNPEVGLNTASTSAYIKAELAAMGYEPAYIAGTGVSAAAGGKKPGGCFMLRADIDALPITELTEAAYKSVNGNMHACGHDLHAAMLLGAAWLLKQHEDEIPGCIKFMFQPGEENLKGAAAMIDDGILESPHVDAAAMFHVMTALPLPAGTIAVPQPGPATAASDWFDIKITGKGGHGAMPHLTVDPLNVLSHLHLALQEINSRELASDAAAVLTVGMMQGGTTPNVIPETAKMSGTIRTFDAKVREHILKRIPEIAEATAAAFRAEAITLITQGCPCVINDAAVIDSSKKALKEVFGSSVIQTADKISFSEDFSFVSQRVPSVMLVLSAGSPDEGYPYAVHHPKVTFQEQVLSAGAAAYAVTALGWLERV